VVCAHIHQQSPDDYREPVIKHGTYSIAQRNETLALFLVF